MRSSDLFLWSLAFIFYVAGDLATTMHNLSEGMVELNPLNVFAVKVIVVFAGILIYLKYRSRAVPAVMVFLGAVAVLHNVLV